MASTTFKDRLAQWNTRAANASNSPSDVVRAATSTRYNDFVRLAAKQRVGVSSEGQSISDNDTPKNRDEILTVRRRLRHVQNSKKTRTQSIRAKPLRDNGTGYEPKLIQKSKEDQLTIHRALKKNFVFDQLADAALEQLVQAFESVTTYGVDDVIIRQGEEGDYFYVVESGEVSFEANGRVLGSANEGSSFGELALLYSCPRAATVRATSNTTVWRLDQRVFRHVLQSKSKASTATKLKLLKSIDFFQFMEQADLQQCISVMTPYQFEVDEFVVRKGDPGESFYIVESGELLITDISVGDTSYEDVTLGPGEFFGERALVKSEPRAGNVQGVKAGTLFSIDRETFERVCGDFVRLILKSQDKNRLKSLKVLQAANLDSYSIAELSRCLRDEVFSAGDYICYHDTETIPALYLVREGRVELKDKHGAKRVVEEGGYFGEENILADARALVQENGNIVSNYTATVLSHNCIVGILTLDNCRDVFDTKSKALCNHGEDSQIGDSVGQEADEFRNICEKRQSRRSLIDNDVLRTSLIRESILGEGQFGEVWQVRSDLVEFQDENEFALKIQSKSDPTMTIETIKRECQVLANLNHPFVVDFVTSYDDEQKFYILMGLIKGCDLWSIIHREIADGEWYSGIPEDSAKFYSIVIVDTLDYMHRHLVAFRDTKPENVMLDESGYPIIVDFGFAKVLNDGVTYTLCGTPQYLAPEIILNTGHGFAADYWAFGVTLYEMIGGENPFYYDGIDDATLLSDICKEQPYPLPDSKVVSTKALDLIDRFLVKDPTQRIGSLANGSREIKAHPWFDGVDLQAAREKRLEPPFLPR